MTEFARRTLSNGLRILVEHRPTALSVGVGFFVRTGARDEVPQIAGVSHFLEHMAFKTTKKRDALAVSRELDRMGARANAYTSWERTVFYAQVLPEFARDAVALLGEMIDPAFLEEDFSVEKKVILEEIEMYNDRPEFMLFETMLEKRYGSHPLGIRILGTRESIGPLSVEQMREYHAARYRCGNVVLAVAGAARIEEVAEWASEITLPEGGVARPTPSVPPPEERFFEIERPEDKTCHFVRAFPGPPSSNIKERFLAQIVSILFGDSEGSRLFWALVFPGIVETLDVGTLSFTEDGIFYIGFSALPENVQKSVEILGNEWRKLAEEGFSKEEWDRAKTKFSTRTILGSESILGRMGSIGGDELEGLPYHSLAEELAIIDSLTMEEAREFIRRTNTPLIEGRIGPK